MKPHQLYIVTFYPLLFLMFPLFHWYNATKSGAFGLFIFSLFLLVAAIQWRMMRFRCPSCGKLKHANFAEQHVPWSVLSFIKVLPWRINCPHCGAE